MINLICFSLVTIPVLLTDYSVSGVSYISLTSAERNPSYTKTIGPFGGQSSILPYTDSFTQQDNCVQSMVEGPGEEIDNAPWNLNLANKYDNNSTVNVFGPHATEQGQSVLLDAGKQFKHTVTFALYGWSQDASNLDTFATGQRVRIVEHSKDERKVITP